MNKNDQLFNSLISGEYDTTLKKYVVLEPVLCAHNARWINQRNFLRSRCAQAEWMPGQTLQRRPVGQ